MADMLEIEGRLESTLAGDSAPGPRDGPARPETAGAGIGLEPQPFHASKKANTWKKLKQMVGTGSGRDADVSWSCSSALGLLGQQRCMLPRQCLKALHAKARVHQLVG